MPGRHRGPTSQRGKEARQGASAPASLTPVRSPHSIDTPAGPGRGALAGASSGPGPDSDPRVAAAIRLSHRRRGWIWATVIAVVAWFVVLGLLGALAPDASGAGVITAGIFVLLLTLAVVVGLIASVIDTLRWQRTATDIRQRARPRTAHYPVLAHAYSYPPRHRHSWVFGWITMLILAGIGVPALPGLVNGVGFATGAENFTTFLPLSYSEDCGRSGCSTVTNGTLMNGFGVTWPNQVPLGRPFLVREPLWNWAFGSHLIDSTGSAIGSILAGVLLDGFAVIVLIHLVKLGSRWLRHRRDHQLGALIRLPRLPRLKRLPS